MPVINYSVSADAELVAAVTGRKIRIHALAFQAADGTTQFESATTLLLGPFTATVAITGPIVLPWSEAGWGDTAAGEALNIDLSGTDANVGTLVYSLRN